jgi:glycosyltransferase involved in cell wall biosynthesis
MYKGKKIAVVVPAYNEELLITETINSIPAYIDCVYLVDDGSCDDTAKTAAKFVNGRVNLISHERNLGVGAAIVTGYKAALRDEADITAVMAGDNQMDQTYLMQLLDPLVEEKADYSKGDRLSFNQHTKGMSPWRRLGNWLLKWLTRFATGNYSLSDPQNGYTAISARALKHLPLHLIYPGYGYCNDILVRLTVYGYRVKDVPMPARYGTEQSKIRYHNYIPRVSWLLLRSFIWRLRHAMRNADFTLNKFEELCRQALLSGYTILPVIDYLLNSVKKERLLVLRHDVDSDPKSALRMAKIEHGLGIRSTYYFRKTNGVFKTHIIIAIAELGHEIGYHYEVLDKTRGNYKKAILLFGRELASLRQLVDIKTICMHGKPLTPWDNRDLWKKYNHSEFGLLGEAYLSMTDKNITYLSDTGRNWSEKHKIKDRLFNNRIQNVTATSTNDVIGLIKNGQIHDIYVVSHPERWSCGLFGWARILIRDTAVNFVKRIIAE